MGYVICTYTRLYIYIYIYHHYQCHWVTLLSWLLSVIVIVIVMVVCGWCQGILWSSNKAFRRSCLMLGRAPRESSGLGLMNSSPKRVTFPLILSVHIFCVQIYDSIWHILLSLVLWSFQISIYIYIYTWNCISTLDYHRLSWILCNLEIG